MWHPGTGDREAEKPEAVRNLEAVVSAFDGIMVARGDLGVEPALDRVPMVQKRAVQLSRDNGKPVIVATQMLNSMIDSPQPTRVEASDVLRRGPLRARGAVRLRARA